MSATITMLTMDLQEIITNQPRIHLHRLAIFREMKIANEKKKLLEKKYAIFALKHIVIRELQNIV